MDKESLQYTIYKYLAYNKLTVDRYVDGRYRKVSRETVSQELADRCADELLAHFRTLVRESKPEKKYHKEFECRYGTYENFCENQDCPNAPKDYNQGVDDYEKRLLDKL